MTLVFLSKEQDSPAGKRRAKYLCSCGVEFVCQVDNVRSGNTKSCGCLATGARTTHGMTNTPLYSAWENMRQRTTNREAYPNYANVHCDIRWVTFAGFLANQPAGRPFEKGLCLSRFNDSGNYTPENTRWLTRQENTREQSHTPKPQCVNGHDRTPDNLTPHGDCRACAREGNRRYKERIRNATKAST